jgi:hypothetical protein
VIVVSPGRSTMHVETLPMGAPKIDKRTLTNAQRVEMGLPVRRPGGKRGPGRICDPYNLNFQRKPESFDTPPEVRLAEQLREMFTRWPDWVIGSRLLNTPRSEA